MLCRTGELRRYISTENVTYLTKNYFRLPILSFFYVGTVLLSKVSFICRGDNMIRFVILPLIASVLYNSLCWKDSNFLSIFSHVYSEISYLICSQFKQLLLYKLPWLHMNENSQ